MDRFDLWLKEHNMTLVEFNRSKPGARKIIPFYDTETGDLIGQVIAKDEDSHV